MDAIIVAAESFRQSHLFTAVVRPVLLAMPLVLVLAVVQRDDLLRSIREALHHAELQHKAVAGYMGDVNLSLVSLRLNGGKPLTVDTLAKLPVEFWQWWAVCVNRQVGTPALVRSGARLARRQARMSLPGAPAKKAGVA